MLLPLGPAHDSFLLLARIGGAGGGLWNSTKRMARTLGNYIMVPCGAGAFANGGGRPDSDASVASVGTYAIASVDSRSGFSKGLFTDITAGEGIQGGYGQAVYTDGSTEHFLFLGLGGNADGFALGASLYGSHVSGDPWYRFQIGLSGDAGIPGLAIGGGSGLNNDTQTSCIDHNLH
jgi:hypothetical protein